MNAQLHILFLIRMVLRNCKRNGDNHFIRKYCSNHLLVTGLFFSNQHPTHFFPIDDDETQWKFWISFSAWLSLLSWSNQIFLTKLLLLAQLFQAIQHTSQIIWPKEFQRKMLNITWRCLCEFEIELFFSGSNHTCVNN